MTRTDPVRAAAALLLAAVAGCSHAPLEPRLHGPEDLSACAAVTAEARAALAAHQACTADWECEPFAVGALGCDGVVASAAEPAGLAQRLSSACSAEPARPLACEGRLPSCLAGRCVWQRPAGGCADALAALRAHIEASPGACRASSDCRYLPLSDGTDAAVSAGALAALAPERRRAHDACGHGRLPVPTKLLPTCVAGACRLEPVTAARVMRPRSDEACLRDALLARADALRASRAPPFQAQFVVDRDGTATGFSFSRPVPAPAQDAVADAVLSCRWAPGTIDGEPQAMWSTLPVRVE
jgi:hypothetical protein